MAASPSSGRLESVRQSNNAAATQQPSKSSAAPPALQGATIQIGSTNNESKSVMSLITGDKPTSVFEAVSQGLQSMRIGGIGKDGASIGRIVPPSTPSVTSGLSLGRGKG